MTRQIRFNAFDMNCVAHQSSGMWRHPDDQSWRYKQISYWTSLAKLLERGHFDGIFIAAIGPGPQCPVTAPIPLVSAMAAVPEHLGFGIPAGTAYEHPSPFARRM